MKTTHEDQTERLRAHAARGELPLASPCPNHCRFCYERHLHRFFPELRVVRTPLFSQDSFASYLGELERRQQPAVPVTPCTEKDGEVLYSSASDAFAQGLSRSMLISLLERNRVCGERPLLATQGDRLDPQLARELSAAFPDTFRVHLSVLTFDHEIREQLISGSAGPEHLGQLVSALREAKIYLLHIDPQRTIADLEQVNRLANRQAPPIVILGRLHHHRLHPPDIKALSEQSAQGFEEVVLWLMRHGDELANVAGVYCHLPAEAYLWSFRTVIRNRLLPILQSPRDLVLCSQAAFSIMRDFVVGDAARLVAITDRLGGSTDFTTTIGTGELVERLRQLRADGIELDRVVVPSSIWWVDQRASLDGGTIDDLRRAFPQIAVEVVPVPVQLISWRLTVEQCYHFYNADLETTLALRHQPELQRALAQSLGPAEHLTPAGFVRRIWLRAESADATADDGMTLVGPQQLAGAGDGADLPALVEYHEPVVERDDSFPFPGRRLVRMGTTQLLVRQTLAGRVRLHNRLERAVFARIIEGCAPEEVVQQLAASPICQPPGPGVDQVRSVVSSLARSWRHLEQPTAQTVKKNQTLQVVQVRSSLSMARPE